MPDRGLLNPASITAHILRGDHPGPWHVGHAKICQLTFEVSKAAAIELLPGDVSRPVPCYARLFALDASDGPAGPFRMAALMVGGRFRMLPRNVLAAGVVEGPVEAFATAFGAPFSAGSVAIERAGQSVHITVAIGSDVVASATLPELRAVDPAMLRWDAWLGYAGPGDNIDLIEYAPQVEASEAFLSKHAMIDLGGSSPHESAWQQLRSLLTISACYAEGQLTLTAPEPQQALT